MSGSAQHAGESTVRQTNYPTQRARHGFTLMELVLAMGVCAIVLAGVNGVFFSAVHLRDSATQAVDAALPVQRALAILRRDLQGVMPVSTSGILAGDFKVGNVTSPGVNQNVAIELYTTTGALHETEPWGDIQRVTYELRATAAGSDLIRSVTRNLLATIAPVPEDQWLMGHVTNLDFDCYDGAQWRTAWDTTVTDTNLPVAVRVRIQLAGDARDRQPITLVVPVDSQTITSQVQSATSS